MIKKLAIVTAALMLTGCASTTYMKPMKKPLSQAKPILVTSTLDGFNLVCPSCWGGGNNIVIPFKNYDIDQSVTSAISKELKADGYKVSIMPAQTNFVDVSPGYSFDANVKNIQAAASKYHAKYALVYVPSYQMIEDDGQVQYTFAGVGMYHKPLILGSNITNVFAYYVASIYDLDSGKAVGGYQSQFEYKVPNSMWHAKLDQYTPSDIKALEKIVQQQVVPDTVQSGKVAMGLMPAPKKPWKLF